MSTFFKWLGVIVCQWLMSLFILAIMATSLVNVMAYWRTANWIPVEGKIIHLAANNFDGSKPDSPWSGGGDLLCEYVYVFEGRNYHGNEIGVEIFDDSSNRSRRYRLLKAQGDAGKLITVLVNPKTPKKSALFRESLPEMYFGPALGLFWFGALFWSWRSKRQV